MKIVAQEACQHIWIILDADVQHLDEGSYLPTRFVVRNMHETELMLMKHIRNTSASRDYSFVFPPDVPT